MILGYHGGQCCGIKTVHALGVGPSYKAPAIKESTTHHFDGGIVSSSTRFFKPAAPTETAKERLHRYIHYLEEARAEGIIEVVVAEGSMLTQASKWKPVLEEFGFKMLNKCKNSNSRNTVFVWHRNSGEVEKLSPLPDSEEPKKATCACGDVNCTVGG